jgi:hypothetical protein
VKSSAYWELVRAGGAVGRNWLARWSTNGVTWAVCVNPAGAKAGGVSWGVLRLHEVSLRLTGVTGYVAASYYVL